MQSWGGGKQDLFRNTANCPQNQNQIIQTPVLGHGEMDGGRGQGGMAGTWHEVCWAWKERGPRYLLGSREGMVEARHISHDGFLIWPSSSDNVCRETEKEVQLKLPWSTPHISQGVRKPAFREVTLPKGPS